MTRWLSFAGAFGAALLSAGTGTAQVAPATQTQSQRTAPGSSMHAGGVLFEFSAVKGLPYSLATTSSTVKTSSDGATTTEVRESREMRDSEGRTRLEVGRTVDGSFEADHMMITDPVAQFQANFDNWKRTGVVSYLPVRTPEERAAFEKRRSEAREARKASGPAWPDLQQLGHRTFLGVDTEGTRRTIVTPAGRQGNANEIRVAEEEWRSAELHIALFTTWDDPRNGKTTSVVTSLQRTEPDAALFGIPEGYTVTVHGKP